MADDAQHDSNDYHHRYPSDKSLSQEIKNLKEQLQELERSVTALLEQDEEYLKLKKEQEAAAEAFRQIQADLVNLFRQRTAMTEKEKKGPDKEQDAKQSGS